MGIKNSLIPIFLLCDCSQLIVKQIIEGFFFIGNYLLLKNNIINCN